MSPAEDSSTLDPSVDERSAEFTSTRAQFLRSAAGAGAGAAIFGSLGAARALASGGGARAAAGGTLNVYSWPNYFSAQNLKRFKAQTGISLNISTYESSDALFAKLNTAAGAGFDLTVPTGGWIPEMAQKGLLAKLDHSRIPFKFIDPALLNKVYDPHNVYSIPKDFGVSGVSYDPVAVGGTIKTWQDFLDAGAKPGVSGKVQLSTSAYDVLGPAIWAHGGDWNTLDKSVIEKAGAVMKGFAKHVKEFNGFDSTGLVQGTVVLSYNDQSLARVAMLQNPKLRFVVPGPISELWVDSYAITAHAPDLDNVYKFLNFQLQPENQVTDAQFISYPTALPHLESKLPKNLKLKDLIFGGKGLDLDKLTSFVLRPSTVSLYQSLVTEVMAAATA
jgi:spermidine/putrescine transport system substrate-binding protein